MRRRKLLVGLIGVAAALGIAAGCGDDDSSASETTETTAPATSEAPSTTDAAPTTEAAPSDGAATVEGTLDGTTATLRFSFPEPPSEVVFNLPDIDESAGTSSVRTAGGMMCVPIGGAGVSLMCSGEIPAEGEVAITADGVQDARAFSADITLEDGTTQTVMGSFQ